MRYILKYAQKRSYCDKIKLNSAKIKLYYAGRMSQFLFGMELYKDECVMSPRINYYFYSNVLASLLFY